MQIAQDSRSRSAADPSDAIALRDHLVATVNNARLERDPFCHIYLEEVFPPSLYNSVLRSLPPPNLYEPLNLRKWVRADGTSTRDQFYPTQANLALLPEKHAALWGLFVRAVTDGVLKRTLFAKLAPDIADRFGVPEDRVPDIECVYDICLVRDTEDYRIKPHPDGLNKIVTFQFYLPPDETTLDLGTSLFQRERSLLGGKFREVKRFPFKPNSAYAFAVSDSDTRKSWHGRDRLTGFTSVRNTLMLLFQQTSPREFVM